MIAKEDLEALESLKATQESLTFSLEIELKKLQSQYKALESEHDQQKSHLIEALLFKDKFQRDLADKNQIPEALATDKDATKQLPSETGSANSREVSKKNSSYSNVVATDIELAAELALLGKRPSVQHARPPAAPTIPSNAHIPSYMCKRRREAKVPLSRQLNSG
jgi:hypothetical protein